MNLTTDLFIRADGSTETGMGHVMRCIALAEMLGDHFNLHFVMQAPSDAVLRLVSNYCQRVITLPRTSDFTEDALNFSACLRPGNIVVLDGYSFDAHYQATIQKLVPGKLVVIDDLVAGEYYADMIINHAPEVDISGYKASPGTRILAGTDYALLRKELLSSAAAQPSDQVKRIFLSMGAADVHNLSAKFCDGLLRLPGITEIHLIAGAVNPHLPELHERAANSAGQLFVHVNISSSELLERLGSCDLAICPASTLALECCAARVPLVSGYSAENQKGILRGLEHMGALYNLGDLHGLTAEMFNEALLFVINNADFRMDMSQRQSAVIDGRSPERLLKAFRELSSNRLMLRKAVKEDALLYYEWLNEPAVRANSFQQNAVSWEDHQRWFAARVDDPDFFFYLFFGQQGQPVGQVRITRENTEAVISISIAAEFRGQSLSLEMIRRACEHFHTSNQEVPVIAYIKTTNKGSYRAFVHGGFREIAVIDIAGDQSYKLERRGTVV